VGNFVFNVYLVKPDQSVDYRHGPGEADCFDLPPGWTFVSTSFKGFTKIGVEDAERYEVTVKPAGFVGGTGRVRNKSYCGLVVPQFSQWVTFNISRPATAPRNLTGSNNICAGSLVNFSLSTQPGDGYFSWSTGGEMFVSSGQGSTSVQVGTNITVGSSYVRVGFSDGCSNSLIRVNSVIVGAPNNSTVTVDNNLTNPGPVSVSPNSTHYFSTQFPGGYVPSYSISAITNSGNIVLNLTGVNRGS
jgi:hypothetical protein